MRFKVQLEVNGEDMNIDYRRKITHIFKTELDEEVLKEFFSKNKIKLFTWSAYFVNAKFEKEKIIFKNDFGNINLYFSFYNYIDGINFYNSFAKLKQKKKKINISENASASVKSITMIKEKEIKDSVAIFKTLSPIVCRNNESRETKNIYYYFKDKEFEGVFKENLKNKISSLEIYKEKQIYKDIKELKIEEINLKKTVVKFYGKNNTDRFDGLFCNASLGIIKITGKTYLLDFIYKSGLGSLTGNGFGYLDLV